MPRLIFYKSFLKRFSLLGWAAVFFPALAHASFSSVSGSEINEGILTASLRSTYGMDKQQSRARWLGRIGVDYGLTDNYALGLFVQGERRRNDELEFEAFLIDQRFEWHSAKRDGFYSGMRARYTMRDSAKAPDNARLQLIVGAPFGNWEARLNQLFTREMGEGRQHGILLETRGRIHYQWRDGTQLGMESINNFGQMGNIQTFDTRRHELGPSLSGDLDNGYTYDLAYRRGLSERATDHIIRFGFTRVY